MDTTGRTVSPLTSSQFRIAGLFVSVFLNAAGFTLIDPVMPLLVGRYTGDARVALAVGLLMSAYSLCECVAAPVLGAAGGLGFMLGPVIGGTVTSWSPSAPLFLAAALTLANAAWVYFAIHAEDVRRRPESSSTPLPLPLALRRALATTLLFYLAGTMLQANVSVILRDVKQFDPAHIGMVQFAVGVMDVLSQGIATRLLLPAVGEYGLARAGLVVNACGFLMIAAITFVPSVAFLFAAIAVFTFGDGLFQPAMSGMIANAAPERERGQIQGANQGRQAIARVLAPLCAACLYDRHPAAPYAAGAAIIAGAYALLSARPRGE
jgi:DHA1 family tetracycline resistance protein-like MFS transporter